MPNSFSKVSGSGLNAWPAWLVTTAMALAASLGTASLVFSDNVSQSGGTAIWQTPLESFTIFQPAGVVCARALASNERNRVAHIHSLLAEVYRPVNSPTINPAQFRRRLPWGQRPRAALVV